MNEEVRKAAGFLKKGLVILYPTDTIWGIGCDATSAEAVSRIYRIKQRPDHKQMLVLVDGLPMLSSCVEEIPDAAREAILTPARPTTIIYPGAINLADNLVAEDGSVGIRITLDPFCRLLIRALGRPVVSTSANISGREAPASFAEIDPEITAEVDYVVDWRQEETGRGRPSTILKLDRDGNLFTIRP